MNMMLPFLKKRRLPRIQTEPNEEKLINASSEDHIDDHCIGEMFDAVESKDPKKFHQALEALFLNMFDWKDADAADER